MAKQKNEKKTSKKLTEKRKNRQNNSDLSGLKVLSGEYSPAEPEEDEDGFDSDYPGLFPGETTSEKIEDD